MMPPEDDSKHFNLIDSFDILDAVMPKNQQNILNMCRVRGTKQLTWL